jgi:hypothetical protein
MFTKGLCLELKLTVHLWPDAKVKNERFPSSFQLQPMIWNKLLKNKRGEESASSKIRVFISSSKNKALLH